MAISIHVPSWGTTLRWVFPLFPLFYFNPRSLVGNDRAVWIDLSVFSISIHVPSWGTTCTAAEFVNLANISIHVPSWGTTGRDRRCDQRLSNFNPRSLVGNDNPRRAGSAFPGDFNPRSLVGNDPGRRQKPWEIIYFNPRSLVGNDG